MPRIPGTRNAALVRSWVWRVWLVTPSTGSRPVRATLSEAVTWFTICVMVALLVCWLGSVYSSRVTAGPLVDGALAWPAAAIAAA